MRKTQTNLLKRRVHSAVIAGTFFLASLFAVTLMAQTNFAGALMAQTNQPTPGDKDEIEDLMTCYAYGSDALAKAVAAAAGPAAGIEIYEGCLADDWTMTLVGADGPIAGPFDRELWATIVYYTAFEPAGVIDSQHMIGSTQIETSNDRGSMKAYAIVNLVDDTNVRTQIITYTNEVERRTDKQIYKIYGYQPPSRWVITSTTLEITAESASQKM